MASWKSLSDALNPFEEEKTPSTSPPPVEHQAPAVQVPGPWPVPPRSAPADQILVAEISSAIFAADSPYAHLRTTIDALAEDIPDRAQRFKVALKTLKSLQGIEPEAIRVSLHEGLKKLDIEEADFQAQYKERQAELITLDASVKEIEGKIAQMKDSLNLKQSEFKDKTSALSTRQEAFDNALNTIKNTIDSVDKELSGGK